MRGDPSRASHRAIGCICLILYGCGLIASSINFRGSLRHIYGVRVRPQKTRAEITPLFFYLPLSPLPHQPEAQSGAIITYAAVMNHHYHQRPRTLTIAIITIPQTPTAICDIKVSLLHPLTAAAGRYPSADTRALLCHPFIRRYGQSLADRPTAYKRGAGRRLLILCIDGEIAGCVDCS